MGTVTVGGKDRQIQPFNAYKALLAMELVGGVRDTWRAVLSEAAEFKRAYEAENYVELRRAEARYQLAPAPLTEVVREEDPETGATRVLERPVLDEEGVAIAGPDPLGHLSETDWEGSGQTLRISQSPSEGEQLAAMVPVAVRLGKVDALRLIALALVDAGRLEEWVEAGEDVDSKLDEEARRLTLEASLGELVQVAVATAVACREELAGPLGDARRELGRLLTPTGPTETVPEPMTLDADETPASPTSSTDSPAPTGGEPERSRTAPVGASSSSSAPG